MNEAVVYEITTVVAPELVKKYEKYMRERHIPDLLATGHFRGARFTRSNENCFRVIYEAHNQEALDKYLETKAAGLRADFSAHFPTGIELSRNVWRVIEDWRGK